MKPDQALSTTTRRAVLAGAVTTAVAAAVAAPALAAAEPDPVYAAIAKCRAAEAAVEAHAPNTDAVLLGREPTPEAEAAQMALLDAWNDAEIAFVETVPTTRKGVVAALQFASEGAGFSYMIDRDSAQCLLLNLAESLENVRAV